METVDIADRAFLDERTLAPGLHGLLEHGGQVDPLARIAIGAAGLVGQLLQGATVKFGKHHGATLVLHQTACAVGDHGSGLGTDAESDHADALGLQLGDQRFPVVVGGFAIAQDDQKPVRAVGRGERLDRGPQQSGIIGAALGQIIGPEHREKLAQDFVIGAEWALEKGRAGKHEQPHALALEPFEQGLDEQLRAIEARRFHVLRLH